MNRRIHSFSNYLEKFISKESLDEQAYLSGFKKRSSLMSPQSFLETVFHESSSGKTSLSQYCMRFHIASGKRISKQAMDKKFKSGAKQFLSLLLEKALKKQFSFSNHHSLQAIFSEVRIMDSTEFKLSPALSGSFPGYGGKGRESMAKVQLEYELLDGKITRLKLGNSLNSDIGQGMKHLDEIPEKALLVRDMGYVNINVYKELIKRNLFFISRLKPQLCIYIQKDGELKELRKEDLLRMLSENKTKYLDIDAFIGRESKLPVRLIANLLNEEQKNRRIKRKITRKGKANKKDKLNACFNVFITNVSEEVCQAQKIYELYRVRWQIELIFKAWKSILKIHQINPVNTERFECLMYIKFIWILLNWSMVQLFTNLAQKEISHYKFTRTLIINIQSFIRKAIQSDGSLNLWLHELFKLSLLYHLKEYKKGSPKIGQLLSLKH